MSMYCTAGVDKEVAGARDNLFPYPNYSLISGWLGFPMGLVLWSLYMQGDLCGLVPLGTRGWKARWAKFL